MQDIHIDLQANYCTLPEQQHPKYFLNMTKLILSKKSELEEWSLIAFTSQKIAYLYLSWSFTINQVSFTRHILSIARHYWGTLMVFYYAILE